MKKFITYIILFFTFLGYSQTDENYEVITSYSTTKYIDSIINETEKFIKYKVNHIQLIKILPKCKTKWIYNVDGSKTSEKECNNETIIKENKNKQIKLEEKLIGNKVEINKSESIAFLKNLYDLKMNLVEYRETSCYNPNHGIKFFDSRKKIIGFLEICFECGDYRIAGDIPGLNPQSEVEFDTLKQIFKKYNMIK